jgi:hypothetical protein
MTEPTYHPNKRQNNKNSLSLPLIQSNSNNLNTRNKNEKLFHSLDRKNSKNKKIKINKRISTTHRKEKRIKINKDLDLVNKLDMEQEVDELFQEESRLRKQKEKIDNSPDIIAKRLNVFKNAENGEKKIEVDSKEKEKYIEKEFKDELEEFTKIKNECNIINEKINDIRIAIDDYQLELNVFNKYGDELDKKYALEMKEKEKNRLLDTVLNNQAGDTNQNIDSQDAEEKLRNSLKNEKLEYLNSVAQIKKQRDEKMKIIELNKSRAQTESIELEKKYNELMKQCGQKKSVVYKARNQLLNIYHLELYEGLTFRTDGLATLIRSIWNLGVNVDINYMPSYLDKLSIDFLFDKARRLIKISEMRQIIEENQLDFENSVNAWKKTVNENTKDSSEEKTDENFFKTGVMDRYNYMNKYPNSKKFMEDYNKKYFSKADTFEIKLNKNKKLFKSKNIPATIIDKHHKIEKLKILLNNLLEKNDGIEKKEIQRLCREFTTNNYQDKYHVSVDVIMGALCGEEKRNEAITFFAKYQKEYKEGKQLIQFHKLNSKFNQK